MFMGLRGPSGNRLCLCRRYCWHMCTPRPSRFEHCPYGRGTLPNGVEPGRRTGREKDRQAGREAGRQAGRDAGRRSSTWPASRHRHRDRNRNRNRKLQTSKAPLKSQAQVTSLFTSAGDMQRRRSGLTTGESWWFAGLKKFLNDFFQ